MNKDIVRKIKIAASWLPPETMKIKVRKVGAQLIKDGIIYVNIAGIRHTIIPGRQYVVDDTAPVNHEERLKAAWKKDRVNGIENYLKKYDGHIQKLREAKQKSNEHSSTGHGAPIPDRVPGGGEGGNIS